MKSKATWGMVPSTTDNPLWVRLLDRHALTFECGLEVISGGERGVVAGLSVNTMAMRKTVLPFTRRDQIWAVLPQESLDTLFTRFENPCFALQWEPVEQGAAVFFAMSEQQSVDELLARLATMAIKPMGVVMAEVGAWPLLEASNLLAMHRLILVVDGSTAPAAVYSLLDGRLQELRLVAPATTALGESAVLEELDWLITDLISRQPDINPAEIKLIFLGKSREEWQPISDKIQKEAWITNIEIPDLATLGQGLKQWKWIRPAGLALSAAQGTHSRMMDFLNGEGERQWQTWLRPWKGAAILALALLMIWGGEKALRYTRAHDRYLQLKIETDATFREALPHVPVIMDPQMQLKQALGQSAMAKDGQFPGLGSWLGIIQTAVSAETQVKWMRLRYEPGEVQLTGEVPSYKHLDRVRAALQQVSGGKETRMDEARIVAETKTVRFRLGLL
ncbi:MAG: hypothetical protein HQL94_09475 [Magnetococcales bacterium]|nr:hypothetical protein [Magnetococcales bacterium]MBF0440083.1 hypothetical protein [Magnetococcales bacterium]